MRTVKSNQAAGQQGGTMLEQFSRNLTQQAAEGRY